MRLRLRPDATSALSANVVALALIYAAASYGAAPAPGPARAGSAAKPDVDGNIYTEIGSKVLVGPDGNAALKGTSAAAHKNSDSLESDKALEANEGEPEQTESMEDVVVHFDLIKIPVNFASAKGKYPLLGEFWAEPFNHPSQTCLCHEGVEIETEAKSMVTKISCGGAGSTPQNKLCPEGTRLKLDATVKAEIEKDWRRQIEIQKILSDKSAIKTSGKFTVGQKLFLAADSRALLLRKGKEGSGLSVGRCTVEPNFPMKVMGFIPSTDEVLLGYDGVCDEASRYHGENLLLVNRESLYKMLRPPSSV